jgi:hypothetical protein
MSAVNRDFTAILLARQIISPAQLAKARRHQARTGARLGDALVRLGYATTEEILRACAESRGLAFLDLTGLTVPPAIIELVPESVARENLAFPVSLADGVLTVAVGDPTDFDTLQKLQFLLNRDVRPVLVPREQIIEAINRHYGQTETESVDSVLQEFTDTQIDFRQTDPDGPSGARPRRVVLREALQCLEGSYAPPSRPAGPPADRRATVRYYHRMNPGRLFPLLVVLSHEAVLEVAKRGVAQGGPADPRRPDGRAEPPAPLRPAPAQALRPRLREPAPGRVRPVRPAGPLVGAVAQPGGAGRPAPDRDRRPVLLAAAAQAGRVLGRAHREAGTGQAAWGRAGPGVRPGGGPRSRGGILARRGPCPRRG